MESPVSLWGHHIASVASELKCRFQTMTCRFHWQDIRDILGINLIKLKILSGLSWNLFP